MRVLFDCTQFGQASSTLDNGCLGASPKDCYLANSEEQGLGMRAQGHTLCQEVPVLV